MICATLAAHLVLEAGMTSLLSWSVDADGQLTHVSQPALDFFNQIPSQVLGRHVDVFLGQRLDFTAPQTDIPLQSMDHNGCRVYIQALRVYEDNTRVGTRFVASTQEPLKISSGLFSGIFNLPSWVLLVTLVGLSVACGTAMALGQVIVQIAAIVGCGVMGGCVWKWNRLRSDVVDQLCAVKNRLVLHNLTLLPQSIRCNPLVSSCHRTQMFTLTSSLRDQEALRISNVFAESVYNTSSPTVVTDGQLNILQSNRAFCELFEHTAQHFERRSLSDVIPLTTIPFTSVVFEATRKGRVFSVTVDPYFVNDNVSYVSFTFTDVTVMRRDEHSILSVIANPEISISLEEHNVFFDNLEHLARINAAQQADFVRNCLAAVNCTTEHTTLKNMQEDLIVQLKRMDQQMSDIHHLSKNLETHKSLLGDFIPHQSNLLDALLEEIAKSNSTSSLLKDKSHEIEKFSDGLHCMLKQLALKSHEQKLKMEAIQNDICINTEHLNTLRLDCDNPVLSVELTLEERLYQQQTGNSLMDASGMAQAIHSNFIQWDQETNEFLKMITEAAASSYDMLQSVTDNSQQIKHLIQNVENTYEVVDVMCQDQIVHSSIGEYITHEVDSIQATLKLQ